MLQDTPHGRTSSKWHHDPPALAAHVRFVGPSMGPDAGGAWCLSELPYFDMLDSRLCRCSLPLSTMNPSTAKQVQHYLFGHVVAGTTERTIHCGHYLRPSCGVDWQYAGLYIPHLH